MPPNPFKNLPYKRLLRDINRREAHARSLGDSDIRKAVLDIRQERYSGKSLDALLPRMYALVREAARRTLNMRHFDVQMLGGVGLHKKNVIEMDTGEGKTLVATLTASLHALDHKGVHIVTVNDYLAERDTKWMGPVYEMLGFTCGCVLCDASRQQRRDAYACDITYTTVRTLGFDFLQEWFEKDPQQINMRQDFMGLYSVLTEGREESCLRGRYFAILDEADSVLIDFARAPIVITEPSPLQVPAQVYSIAEEAAQQLKEGEDYKIDYARRQVELLEPAKEKAHQIEERHSFFRLSVESWQDRLTDAIAAAKVHIKGRDYMVQDGSVVLVDDLTGRLLLGQRYGRQLHQALEAKERVPIRPETRTARKITIQALFRAFKELGGMTGTAWGARKEFKDIYRLGVYRLPPNKPSGRNRLPDLVYPTADERWEAVVKEMAQRHERGQPILVGTRSVRASEHLSEMLKDRKIDHELLNATHHAAEAEVIKDAGRKGMVTVAANMAGRGVDIVLGPGVGELGGLFVVGTERHEINRFDHQLGGRCGRQGDPGEVRYYASMEDDILKALPEKRYRRAMRRFGAGSGPIRSDLPPRLFDRAQNVIETYFAHVRKDLMYRDEFYEYLQKTPV